MKIIRPTWIIEDDRNFNSSVDPVFTALNKINANIIPGVINIENRTLKNIERLPSHKSPVIFYGSQPFIKSCNIKLPFYFPGSRWTIPTNFLCSTYYNNFTKYILNDMYFIRPFSCFYNNYKFYFKHFKTENLFIRPNSHIKVFDGQILSLKNIENSNWHNIPVNSIMDTLIIIALQKSIVKEFRFFICGNRVISYSEYHKTIEYDEKLEVPKKALNFAKKIANNLWQPALIYALDIALLEDGDYKIIEVNPFNSCSFYNSNIPRILIAAEKIAIQSNFL